MENSNGGISLDTKKRYLYILIFGIALVLIVIIFVILQNSKPKAATTIDQSNPKQSYSSQNEIPNNEITSQELPLPTVVQSSTPEEVTSKFYSWYLSYSENPYASGVYKTSSYLTTGFKNIISSFGPYDGTHDPIVCAVSKKSNFLVKPASPPDANGFVNVLIAINVPNGRNIYRAVLQKNDGKWLIDDFICIPK